jgi:hypothetical protein
MQRLSAVAIRNGCQEDINQRETARVRGEMAFALYYDGPTAGIRSALPDFERKIVTYHLQWCDPSWTLSAPASEMFVSIHL